MGMSTRACRMSVVQSPEQTSLILASIPSAQVLGRTLKEEQLICSWWPLLNTAVVRWSCAVFAAVVHAIPHVVSLRLARVLWKYRGYLRRFRNDHPKLFKTLIFVPLVGPITFRQCFLTNVATIVLIQLLIFFNYVLITHSDRTYGVKPILRLCLKKVMQHRYATIDLYLSLAHCVNLWRV